MCAVTTVVCPNRLLRATLRREKVFLRPICHALPDSDDGAVRRRFVLLSVVATVAVVAVVAVLVVRTLRPDQYTTEFAADGVAPVTVTVPGSAGRPTISAQPAVRPAALPSAVRPLSKPVRIDADDFDGDARITMTYDPSALPVGAEPADLRILMRVPEAGMWLPAGDEVDTDAHTVTVTTPHLSDWVLAITDPAELEDVKAVQERMNWTLSGRIASLLTVGEQDVLSCDAAHLLLPARAASDVAVGTMPLCQEALDDGTYRLHWVNTTGLPVVFDLPPGFSAEQADNHSDVLLQTVLQRRNHPHGVIVRPGKSLLLAFPGTAVTPSTSVTGVVDWSIYLIAMMRQITSALLLDDETDNPQARAYLDASFAGVELANCVADAVAERQSSGGTFRTLFTLVWKCKGRIYDALAAGLRTVTKKAQPKGLARVLGKALGKRLDLLLAVEDFMEIARSEIAGLTTIPAVVFGKLDTSITIQPSRVMSAPEARALPVTGADRAGSLQAPCLTLSSGRFPPAGLPDPGLCYQSVALDLDGNGKSDRLILWRPESDASTPLDPKYVGAVAYLDDGSFHRLADPPSAWGADLAGGSLFQFRQAVYLGAGTRAAAMVSVVSGSSTLHSVLVALVGDELRTVRTAGGGTFDLPDGGGAGYTSGFGCVRAKGQPLFVTRGTLTEFGSPESYHWGLTYYRYSDGTLTQTDRREGTARTLAAVPSAGSDCSTVVPGRR